MVLLRGDCLVLHQHWCFVWNFGRVPIFMAFRLGEGKWKVIILGLHYKKRELFTRV